MIFYRATWCITCRIQCSLYLAANGPQTHYPTPSSMPDDLRKSTWNKCLTEKSVAISPWSKKIAKPCPPKNVKAQSPKRRPKKWKRQQSSSEESEEESEVLVSHSLKQKSCSASHHSTPTDIEEVAVPELNEIETVLRASSVAVREHGHGSNATEEEAVRFQVWCGLKGWC